MKIKKDMMVKVVSGNFKGMTGKVLKVIPIKPKASKPIKSYQSLLILKVAKNINTIII